MRTQTKIRRDPARPNWPGVLLITETVTSIVAGKPENFSDSYDEARKQENAIHANTAD